MEKIIRTSEIPVRESCDVLVAGGGVAGVTAALCAAARGKKVVLLEKSCMLGGLATLGLINYFVPMCNGRGTQICKGMAETLLRKSAEFSWDTIPDVWQNGDPEDKSTACPRYTCRYSANVFAVVLTDELKRAGVELLYDCIAADPVMEKGRCVGVVTESKSGKQFIRAKMVIDTTGDADLLRRSGMPTVAGKNFYTYAAKAVTLDSCRKALEAGDIGKVYTGIGGGGINLFGKNQPADKPQWSGLTVDDVSDYLIDNQSVILEKLKKSDRKTRDIVMLPGMPQFRTTGRIDGDYTMTTDDVYRHFDDSVCAVCDFEFREFLYEVPFRALTRKGFPNLITAGRSASGDGYLWGVLRVIPPAILTGQAAGEAAVLAIESDCAITDVNIAELQRRLAAGGVMIHFPDELVFDDHDTAKAKLDHNIAVRAGAISDDKVAETGHL